MQLTMHARITNAAIWSGFTLLSIGTRGANAEVILEQVDAVGTVLTWCRFTITNVSFASLSGAAGLTATSEAVYSINAGSAIETFSCFAFVYINLQVITSNYRKADEHNSNTSTRNPKF